MKYWNETERFKHYSNRHLITKSFYLDKVEEDNKRLSSIIGQQMRTRFVLHFLVFVVGMVLGYILCR